MVPERGVAPTFIPWRTDDHRSSIEDSWRFLCYVFDLLFLLLLTDLYILENVVFDCLFFLIQLHPDRHVFGMYAFEFCSDRIYDSTTPLLLFVLNLWAGAHRITGPLLNKILVTPVTVVYLFYLISQTRLHCVQISIIVLPPLPHRFGSCCRLAGGCVICLIFGCSCASSCQLNIRHIPTESGTDNLLHLRGQIFR